MLLGGADVHAKLAHIDIAHDTTAMQFRYRYCAPAASKRVTAFGSYKGIQRLHTQFTQYCAIVKYFMHCMH